MSFTRDDLRGLELSDEQVEKVMSLHGQEVQTLKEQVNDFSAKNNYAQEELKSYKQRIEEKESELNDLQKKAKNGDDLSETLEALKEANKQKDAQHKKEMDSLKLKYEVSKALTNAGARNERAVLALIDTDNLTLSNEGHGVIGIEDQLKNLKESDSYLFNEETNNNSQDNSNSNSLSYNAGGQQGNGGIDKSDKSIGINNARRLLGKK